MNEVNIPQRSDREVRYFDLDSIQLRADKQGEAANRLEGHAAVFGKKSEDMGGWREVIDPGFFSDVLNDDVRALFNHDPNYILGRNKAKTLELKEDNTGLFSNILLPDTSYARDLKISVERGDITQMSFAFRIDYKKGEAWEVDGEMVSADKAFEAMWDKQKHEIVRHLVKAKRLFDISPVTYPAYPQTDVKARAMEFKDRQVEVKPASAGPAPKEGADLEMAKRKLKYGLSNKK